MKRRRLPPNVSSFKDRHGKERFRYRKAGQKTVYLKGDPGTERNPSDEYRAMAAAGAPLKPGEGRAVLGSVDDLVARYYISSSFKKAGPDTQRVNRGLIESFRAEFGRDLVSNFTFAHIETILQKRAEKRQEGERTVGGPVAARNLHKQLKRLFRLAVKLEWIKANPAELAEGVKVPKTGGRHTWTEEEIAQFQKRHPLGTRARLAMEIMLWTGQRRGDARLFGPAHLKGGRIKYQQGKTGKDVSLQAAPDLLRAIAAMPSVGITTFLVTEFGKPFSKAGFGNWFRDQCDKAGLPQCSAHGLRKAIARRLAESGAGNQGIKAVGGWSGDTEVATYTAEVDQQRLADTTLGKLWREEE